MRSEIVNRIVFVLVCAGAGVSLITGIFHAMGASLPCGPVPEGGVSGCDRIARSAWATIFGVPTAFYGTGLYVLVGFLAAMRERGGMSATRRLGSVMWFLLLASSIVSVVLLAYATFEIEAVCQWCWASGILMFLGLVSQTVGLAKPGAEGGRRWPVLAYGLFGVVVLGGSLAWGYQVAKAGVAASVSVLTEAPDVELAPADSPSIGPIDAPVTIIAFSDLHCPSCSKNHFELKSLMASRLEDQVRLVYRHYPLLHTHPDSGLAAVLSEWARDQGKFWEFADLMMGNQDHSQAEQMIELLSRLELDVSGATALIQDPSARRPYVERVNKDRQDAYKLGVTMTPTWFVKYPDGSILKAAGDGIHILLAEGELAKRGYQPR